MTEVFEFALNRLVTIKFTVDDDPSTPILAHDRLISRSQIDDAKACMAKAHTPVFRNPVSLTIGSTMKKAMGSPMQRSFRYGRAAREKCYDSAHYCYSIRCEALYGFRTCAKSISTSYQMVLLQIGRLPRSSNRSKRSFRGVVASAE